MSYARYVEEEIAWEDIQSDATLSVGQILKFSAEVCSHSKAMNVVTAIDGLAMVGEIDSDGDAKFVVMVVAGISGLVYSVGSYWLLRRKLIGAVQVTRRRTVSEHAGASSSVPSSSTGGRSSR